MVASRVHDSPSNNTVGGIHVSVCGLPGCTRSLVPHRRRQLEASEQGHHSPQAPRHHLDKELRINVQRLAIKIDRVSSRFTT